MRTALIGLAIPLVCALCAGCLVPYGYPKLSHVPTALMGEQPADCHAFRVDVTADIIDMGESDDYLLGPIPLGKSGKLPSQSKVSLDYGFYVFGIALNYPVCR